MKKSKTNTKKFRRAYTLVELLAAAGGDQHHGGGGIHNDHGAAKTSLYVTAGTDTISQVERRRTVGYAQRLSDEFIDRLFAGGPAESRCQRADAEDAAGLEQQQHDVRRELYAVEREPGGDGLAVSLGEHWVTGVTAFTITRNTLTTPETVTMTITAGTSPSISRTVTIYCFGTCEVEMKPESRRRHSRGNRRGNALILAIVVSVVITGMVITLAWSGGVQAETGGT